MMNSALVAALHYLALALGLGSVFSRGRAIRGLLRSAGSAAELDRLFAADTVWGIAALLWMATGLARAFGGLEKGSAFYLHHPLFWLKMALFGAVFALELAPMVTFVRWRIQRRRGLRILPAQPLLVRFRRINDLETAIVVLIPFVASMMARGIGLR